MCTAHLDSGAAHWLQCVVSTREVSYQWPPWSNGASSRYFYANLMYKTPVVVLCTIALCSCVVYLVLNVTMTWERSVQKVLFLFFCNLHTFFPLQCDQNVISWNGHLERPPVVQSCRGEVRDCPGWHLETHSVQDVQFPIVHHTAPQSQSQQLPEAPKETETDQTVSATAAKYSVPPGTAGPERAASETHFPRASLQRLHFVWYRVQLRDGDGVCYSCVTSDGAARPVLQSCVVHQSNFR